MEQLVMSQLQMIIRYRDKPSDNTGFSICAMDKAMKLEMGLHGKF